MKAIGAKPALSRGRGLFLVLLGSALAAGMGYITWIMADLATAPVLPGTRARWTGDHATTVQMFWLFGIVIVFGVLTAVNGLWIIRHRVFSPVLRIALLVATAVLFGDVAFTLWQLRDS